MNMNISASYNYVENNLITTVLHWKTLSKQWKKFLKKPQIARLENMFLQKEWRLYFLGMESGLVGS